MSKKQEMRGDRDERQSRMDDARALQEREAQLAHIPKMEYNSPLSAVGKLAPEGWTYAFKRSHIGDRYDMANWMSIEEEGWEVVPTSSHPKLKVSRGMSGIEQFHDCFYYKGTVLCKIPTSILNKRKNFIASKTYEEIVNLSAIHANKMGDAGLRPGQFMPERQSTKWSNSALPYEKDFDTNLGGM